MRQITETFNVYTFQEANKQLRDKIRNDISYNWDLYSHSMQERIETLKCFADYLHCDLDYSLSCVSDRGEFIKFAPKYYNAIEENLPDLLEMEECNFTGVYYDQDLLTEIKSIGLQAALNNYIISIHNEYEYMLTDEYLIDFCNCNDYEFKDNGKLI